MSKAVINPEAVASLNDAIANVNSYSYTIPTTFDSTMLTEVKAARRGGVVSAYVTIKAGVAASTWHNGIVTGLPERFRPAADTYGTHRVNSSADLAKDMIITLHTSGQVQFLLGTTFNADIPCCFTFVAGAD